MSKTSTITTDFKLLSAGVLHLRGDLQLPPEASIIVPVNAQKHLKQLQDLLQDLCQYEGHHRIEVILVVNNYPKESPPPEIEWLTKCGFRVYSAPDVRRPDERAQLCSQLWGIEVASSPNTINFDADCRIVDSTSLLDWYVQAFRSGYGLAYTHVGHHDTDNSLSLKLRLAMHHTARWVKRNLLGIPTARGSNYAVRGDLFYDLYESGALRNYVQLGPDCKLRGIPIAYSGKRRYTVLTSSKDIKAGWKQLFSYFRYRLNYNIEAIPSRKRPIKSVWPGYQLQLANRNMRDTGTEATNEHD